MIRGRTGRCGAGGVRPAADDMHGGDVDASRTARSGCKMRQTTVVSNHGLRAGGCRCEGCDAELWKHGVNTSQIAHSVALVWSACEPDVVPVGGECGGERAEEWPLYGLA